MIAYALPHEGPAGASIPNVAGSHPDTSQIGLPSAKPDSSSKTGKKGKRP
jgi:hypothetical protein